MTTVTSRTASSARPARSLTTGGCLLAAAAVAAALLAAATPAVVATALLAGGVAAVVDARTGRLPNAIVATAAMPPLVHIVASLTSRSYAEAVGALAGIACFAGPLLVVHLVAPDSIGFGDVKLAAALGAAIGCVDARLGLLALCVATGTTALVGVVRRRRTVPLGPGIVAGSLVALASPWGLGA